MRSWLKKLAFGAATVAIVPSLVSYLVRRSLLGENRALMASSQFLSLFPGLSGQYLRRAFYSRTLESCHPTACIEFGTVFSKRGAQLGENVYIGPRCHIGLADIGDDVLIAANVHIPSGPDTHSFSDPEIPIREQGGTLRQVKIGTGAWIGESAVVMADVGKGSIVAAGAVVIDQLPEAVVAGGIPARVLRRRFDSEESQNPVVVE